MAQPFLSWPDAELDAALWQGIQYLSFDTTVPGFEAVVMAHLARPANGMTDTSVVVEGGDRLRDLEHQVVVTNGLDTIEIRFPRRGDHADYIIRLRDAGADPLHPFFDRARFNFYIDCPVGDCRPPGLSADPPPSRTPAIDLKTKDYRGFVDVLTNWMKATNPAITDHSPASFERMLVELVSHHGDMLSYQQDRVVNESFIDTARERHAMRQHGLLLGYTLDDGEAARTILGFDVAQPVILPEGLVVDLRGAVGEAGLSFVSSAAILADPSWNAGAIIPAAWPEAPDALWPRGSNGLLLWAHGHALLPGQRVAFVQGGAIHVATLSEVEELSLPGWTDDPQNPPGALAADVTRIAFTPPTPHDYAPWRAGPAFILRGNLVDAAHGRPRVIFVEGGNDVPQDAETFPLRRRDGVFAPRRLDDGGLEFDLRALKVPEGPVLHARRLDGTLGPSLELRVDGDLWSREPHLLESRAFDKHYVAAADEDGHVWLHFGDGIHGLRVPVERDPADPANPLTFITSTTIEIRYRLGDAAAGNCAPNTLNHVDEPATRLSTGVDPATLGIVAVTNVTSARGGRAPMSIDAARFAIPESLRHGPLGRAVTLRDYADAAASVEGVARATAVNIDGIFNAVRILVDPEGQGELSPELRDSVYARVDYLRMAGREHLVGPPRYVPLEVKLAVCAEPEMGRHTVRERVLAALRPGTRERMGFFHADRLSFGDKVELSDLIAHAQGVDGVRSVKALVFRRLLMQDEPLVRDIVDLGPIEIARMDGDDNRPRNGVLKVFVMGLDDEDAIRTELGLPPDAPLFDIGGPAAEAA